MSEENRNIGQDDHSLAKKIGNMALAAKEMLADKAHPFIEQYAQLFAHGKRTPVLRRPDEVGLQYEEIFFPSLDGVPLEGWFIPADSDKLLVINHPMPCNRYGFPGHLAPFNLMFGGFEVNFLPELKHLHDAGYNIVTYDMRNHGLSGDGNGGIASIGVMESRDVVGSVRYIKGRSDLAAMRLGLYGRCMGANSTIIAMSKWPEEFSDVRALALLQPVSGRTFIERGAENLKLDVAKSVVRFDERIHELTGFHLDELAPQPYAPDVKVPTFHAQLRRDHLINTSDTQEIFDALGAAEKALFWIEGSDQRFYAYNYFGHVDPKPLLDWFDRHM